MRDTRSLFIPVCNNGSGLVSLRFMSCFFTGMQGLKIGYATATDSLGPFQTRNIAAAAFLESDFEYLLFIDGDMIFDKRHLDLLSEHDDDILGGIYCAKTDALNLCIQELPGAKKELGLMEVHRIGTGFLRIHRSVFEKLKSTSDFFQHGGFDCWSFFWPKIENKKLVGEDFAFCDRARAAGFKIMADTRIQLHHEGIAIYPLKK